MEVAGLSHWSILWNLIGIQSMKHIYVYLLQIMVPDFLQLFVLVNPFSLFHDFHSFQSWYCNQLCL